MDRAKEAIAKSFNNNEEKYKDIFTIIEKRRELQLHRPLHAAEFIPDGSNSFKDLTSSSNTHRVRQMK